MCYTRFTQRRALFSGHEQSGRQVNNDMAAGFRYICDFLENRCDSDTFTVDDLRNEIIRAGYESYSSKWLKIKLLEKYGDHIVFAHQTGRPNVICFEDICTHLITEYWDNERKASTEEESERIVRMAGKLVAAGIRDLDLGMTVYPSAADVTDSLSDNCSGDKWVPSLLDILLKELISAKIKAKAMGQCIVQAARPRTALMPLPLALTVSIDSVCGSSELIKETARLGFCASYDELIRFKQSVVSAKHSTSPVIDEDALVGVSVVNHDDVTERTSTPLPEQPQPIPFTQFVADNVDHDIRTIDGYGTFHGMGIISASAHSGQGMHAPHMEIPVIPRQASRLLSVDVTRNVGVPITPYNKAPKSGLSKVTFEPLQHLHYPTVQPAVVNLSLLWHFCCFLDMSDKLTPNWSGFMQQVTCGPHSSVAHIDLHPVIDLSPNDESCVYSTLLYVDGQARLLGLPVTCITFDQPLWLKAVDICLANDLNIVCRLGGFHLLMSFLGCIGHIMAGAGLEDIFLLNYGPNTVQHMMSGKAFDRAVRGHLLLERALMQLLLELVLGDVSSPEGGQLSSSELQDLHAVCTAVMQAEVDADNSLLLCSDTVVKVSCMVADLKCRLSTQSRTGRLWIQYLSFIQMFKNFIIAERTGNWHLHLSTTADMLCVFAAAGHQNYAKSARLYVQMMNQLPVSHPWLYEQFVTCGFHTVRRTDRFWAGLSTDLLIEQTLMKSLKSQPGLTHGRGMTEPVRHTWVHSMHETARFHLALKSAVNLTSGDAVHTDCGQMRKKRDVKDCQKVTEWLQLHNPFSSPDTRLTALQSGITANEADCVTCDATYSVGSDIQAAFDGIPFLDASIKKKRCVKTIAHLIAQGQQIDHRLVDIDSSTLFYRLIVLVERSPNITSYFNYELTTTPCSLFNGFTMNKAGKAALGKLLKQNVAESNCTGASDIFVIDGGALLHHVKWLRNVPLSDTMSQYVTLVKKRYGRNSIVVFDGYETGPSIKDHEHQRRQKKATALTPDVICSDDTVVSDSQQAFLANQHNKIQFIRLLSERFRKEGVSVIQAKGDADTDIVSTALHEAHSKTVTVAADDTDIFILLLHHHSPQLHDIHLLSQTVNKKSGKCASISIRELHKKLGRETCRQLPAIHAIGGCDTTSGLFGVGKGTVFRKLTMDMKFVHQTAVLQDPDASIVDVLKAGMTLMLAIYGVKSDGSLNDTRYRMFCNMAASSLSRPKPQKLPPTEGAAKYHIMRSHLQAVCSVSLKSDALNPCEWGWKVVTDELMPITTDLPPAPDDLLTVIRCKCKTACISSLCSCRKNNLHCVTACANCHGDSCMNVSKVSPADADDDVNGSFDGHGSFYLDFDDCDDEEIVHCDDS